MKLVQVAVIMSLVKLLTAKGYCRWSPVELLPPSPLLVVLPANWQHPLTQSWLHQEVQLNWLLGVFLPQNQWGYIIPKLSKMQHEKVVFVSMWFLKLESLLSNKIWQINIIALFYSNKFVFLCTYFTKPVLQKIKLRRSLKFKLWTSTLSEKDSRWRWRW